MTLLINWLAFALAFLVASWVIPGFKVRGVGGAFVGAAPFGVLGFLLGWLLYALLGVATLGIGFLFGFITRWVVSAIILLLADALSSKVEVKGFGSALLAALVISVIGTGAEQLLARGAS